MLAPWFWCAACTVYEPSLISGTRKEPPARGGASEADAGTGAPSSGGSLSIDNGGSSDGGAPGEGQGGEGGAEDTDAPGASAGSAGEGGDQASSAGSSGSGGAVVVPTGGSGSGSGGATTQHGLELLDDFETTDVYGLYASGRKPLWYLMNDGTAGSQQPLPLEMTSVSADQAPFSGSSGVLLVACSGYSGWGSGVGVDLLNASGKQPYDLTAYGGIAFWAKVPGSFREVRINVPDLGTDPSGQLCGDGCNDHFGKTLVLTSDWQHHELLFSELSQVGWGLQREELTLAAVYSIHFQVAAGKEVELSIDDLGLLVK